MIVGKNYCQLTAINIQNEQDEKLPYLPSASRSICYFDFVDGIPEQKLYINYSPEFFQTGFYRSYDSLIRVPVNAGITSDDFNYYYSFEVDYINDKIYGVTTNPSIESDKLFVVDINTGNYAIILSDLESPNLLRLDPSKRLCFISQSTSVSNFTQCFTVINSKIWKISDSQS